MFGSELEGYGERFVCFSDKKEEHCGPEGMKYIGEWSQETKMPHGRGIRIYQDGAIHIGYFDDGQAPGNYINIYKNGEF